MSEAIDFTRWSMVSEVCSKADATSQEVADTYGIVATFATALVGLTLIETLLVAIKGSHLPKGIKIDAIRYGELLFVPLGLAIGWSSRRAGSTRWLVVVAAFATLYTAMTQFRGAWMWDGTFDYFTFPRVAWIRAGFLALAVALFTSTFRKTAGEERGAFAGVVGLCLAVILAAVVPKLLPLNSEFAPTRAFFLLATLAGLGGLTFYARNR